MADQAELPTLPVLHSKRLPNPTKFPFAAYSQCHDLLAIVTSAWDVTVLRIASGQSAFVVKRKDPEAEITALSWKRDGACLGVGWSDGTYGIYDGGTGKQLHMTPLSVDIAQGDVADWKLDLLPYVPEDEDEDGKAGTNTSSLGWMGHEVGGGGAREKSGLITTEDWYNDLEDEDEATGEECRVSGTELTDLPRTITKLDVTKILPRLSAIPSHALPLAKGGGSNTKFTTQMSTDNVFAAQEGSKANVVQSLLVCQDNGTVQVLLDETVHIGSCHVRGKPLDSTAVAQSGAHALLTEADDGSRWLNIIDLPLQTLGGPLLHVITTNTKRMQTLLEYVLQTVRCIEHDYTTNVVIPSRFLKSLQGDLDDRKDGSDCVSTFFHLCMTGAFHQDLLKWLVDVIKDANYKRWEQALNGMYTCLQNHIFINLLPALDRLSIAVTTLRGLATFHEGSSKFDCPPHLFSNILDKIDSLRLTAQKMQLTVQSEHRHCRAFLTWIKMQLEIALAEPFSNSALETEEREMSNMDFTLILPYIKESMMVSKLDLHIKDRPGMQGETTKDKFFDHDIIHNMSYERAKKVMSDFDPLTPDEGLNRKELNDPIALVNLPALTCALAGHVRVALEQITEWQSRTLSAPITIQLPLDLGTEITDMVMVPSVSDNKKHTTKLLILNLSQPDKLSIIECNHPESAIKVADHTLPTSQILSARWLPHANNSVLTLLKDDSGNTSVVRHQTPSSSSSSSSSSSTGLTCEVLHIFPAGISFKPERLLVDGRKGKVVCVVFGNEGREWRVLDIDGGKRLSIDDVAEVLQHVGDGDGDEVMEDSQV